MKSGGITSAIFVLLIVVVGCEIEVPETEPPQARLVPTEQATSLPTPIPTPPEPPEMVCHLGISIEEIRDVMTFQEGSRRYVRVETSGGGQSGKVMRVVMFPDLNKVTDEEVILNAVGLLDLILPGGMKDAHDYMGGRLEALESLAQRTGEVYVAVGNTLPNGIYIKLSRTPPAYLEMEIRVRDWRWPHGLPCPESVYLD